MSQTEPKSDDGLTLGRRELLGAAIVGATGAAAVAASQRGSDNPLPGEGNLHIGGGTMTEEMAEVLVRFGRGPESQLPSAGKANRMYHITSGGAEWADNDLLVDTGEEWVRLSIGLDSVATGGLILEEQTVQ